MTGGRPWPVTAVVALLALAALACSLDFGSDSDPAVSGDSGSTPATVPVLRVLEPASGAQVPPNEQIDIRVTTDSTATSFLINVNGRVASRKALPPGQAGPTEAILGWTPSRSGDYTLELIAFNGAQASLPVALVLEVTTAAASAQPGSGSASCTARIVVTQLNFRDGPGVSATRLGQFDVGETVAVIGRNADTSWYRVQRSNGQQAWTSNNPQWLQLSGNCANLPVVTG